MVGIRRPIRLATAAVILLGGLVGGTLGSSPGWSAEPWSIIATPPSPPFQTNFLSGVSCSKPSACVAVGGYNDAGVPAKPLIESWNGSFWSIVPGAAKYSSRPGTLTGVSCSAPSACMAVGDYTTQNGVTKTLIESWNGSIWSFIPSSSLYRSALTGVSCTSPSACTAIGIVTNSSGETKPLIESWNGSVWVAVPSAKIPLSQSSYLYGVSCSNATACMAVGLIVKGINEQTLIESWNGSVWSIVSAPPTPVFQPSFLKGVSCSAPSACTAVGLDGGQTLIEAWNGSAWSVIPSPDTSPMQSNFLDGVSCNGPSICTAVGRYFNSAGIAQTLIESQYRSTWSIVPSPNAPTGFSELYAVSCNSRTSCVAVGTSGQTLVESNRRQ